MKSTELIKLFEASNKINMSYALFKKVAESGFFDNKEIVNTIFNNKESLNSLEFKGDLRSIFNLDETFKTFLGQASKHEEKRINRLHSSALACLLCFQRVSEANQLKFQKGGKEFTLYEIVEYEYENQVFDPKQGKSSLDIALKGTMCESGRNYNILFLLESKFEEYLSPGKVGKIDLKYEQDYKKIFGKDLDYTFERYEYNYNNQEKTGIMLSGKQHEHYCQGIKQMVSHALGIKKEEANQKFKDYDKVILGEILFDFTKSCEIEPYSEDERNTTLKDYREQYKQVCKRLQDIYGTNRVVILDEILTYQELFTGDNRNVLAQSVQQFYNL